MKKIIISPSLLSADFNNLKEEIASIEKGGAEWLHFDVMDGHFVPNISFGLPVLKSIAHTHNLVNDVHIMIAEPKKYAADFIKNGAQYLTFHYEACALDNEVDEVIEIIHSLGGKAGISIKPNTPVEAIYKFLPKLDLVLIMSVEPGFGGQSFITGALDKIKALRKEIDINSYATLIEVDGGINKETGLLCKEAGVDVLVAGSYIFGHDIKERIESLK
jgi:ribulose-phosphate 3-epimerase